jgi:tRNA threonylcarbamoyladenosine biosynthesis protein TsaE
MTKNWVSRSEEESEVAGREIAHLLPADAVVHLIGDLGVGKTLLARAIAAELGADPRDMSSPSFAIVHEYPTRSGETIFHIDGYRLSNNRREWLEIGIPEILGGPGLKLIEWPKEEFEAFEISHREIEIRLMDDDSRAITMR